VRAERQPGVVRLRAGPLQTGTPCRLNGRTIDFRKTEPQPGDDDPRPFSFATERIAQPQVHATSRTTNDASTPDQREPAPAPMYPARSKPGTALLPSNRGQGRSRSRIRSGTRSSSMPEAATPWSITATASHQPAQGVQQGMLHFIPGLENCGGAALGLRRRVRLRPADPAPPDPGNQAGRGPVLAGQINGTTGYEEAAAQGLMAGVNAAPEGQGPPPLILDRSQRTSACSRRPRDQGWRTLPHVHQPGRVRLLLRHDNADRRLTPLGSASAGDGQAWQRLQAKEEGSPG